MATLLNPGRLVQHSDTFYSTHYAYYGKRCRVHTRKYTKRLVDDLKRVEDMLKLKKHSIILRPIHTLYNGLTFPSHKLAYIDPMRHTYGEILHTTIHECLHLKQVQDKRLNWCKSSMNLVWEGETYAVMEVAYKEAPWETDVREQEEEIYFKISGKKIPKGKKKVK